MKITPIGIWGGYPKANEATSSFLIEHEGFHCLIDCGSGVLASLQNYLPLENLDAVVISHYHADHIADLGSLQYSRLIQFYLHNPSTKVLPIYGHKYDKENFARLPYKERTVGIGIAEEEVVQIGPFSVSFCRTVHPVFCLAMKFTVQDFSIVLTADTGWCDELVDFARGADILISEANLYEEHVGLVEGHMGGSEAGKLAEMAGAKQLVLTHFPLHRDIENILKAAKQEFYGPTEIAEVGRAYEV